MFKGQQCCPKEKTGKRLKLLHDAGCHTAVKCFAIRSKILEAEAKK